MRRTRDRPSTGELKFKPQLSFQAMKRNILIDALAQHRFEQQQEEREKLRKNGLLEQEFSYEDLFV